MLPRDGHCIAKEVLQVIVRVGYVHGCSAKNIGGTHEAGVANRTAELFGTLQGEEDVCVHVTCVCVCVRVCVCACVFVCVSTVRCVCKCECEVCVWGDCEVCVWAL